MIRLNVSASQRALISADALPIRAGYQHMVHDDYVRRLKAIRRERVGRLSAIRNRHQAENYQDQIRKAIQKAFSPIPARTPLNPRITGVVERKGYRIEKIIFESRPKCYVTANLYLPEKLSKPCPGVIAPCGHSANGKAFSYYQYYPQRLAHAGFMTLIYDPFSQGERDQYFRLPKQSVVRTNCCAAHNMMGKQLELVGEYFGMWRAWDGIRALDYLLTRPEVDHKHIGVSGSSGGGTLTTWLWAIEPRLTMAAPSCFITTFLANLENEIPADCEQYPPGVIGAGLELGDFLMARAPDPIILLGEKYDMFDLRGLQEIFKELRRFYSHFGASDKARLFVGPNNHCYYHEQQQTMVSFFCHQAGLPALKHRPGVRTEKDETLLATPRGQVVPAGSEPIYKMIARQSQRLAASRKPPCANPDPLGKKIVDLLHLPARKKAPHYRVLRAFARHFPFIKGETIFNRFAVETECEIMAILRKRVMVYEPTLKTEKTVNVYLPHLSSEIDAAQDTLVRSLMIKGPVYFVDARGLGESLPDETGEFTAPYGMDYMFHGHGILFGESYLGRRVHDVLSVLDLLTAEGACEINLFGRGQGAIMALLAGLLHARVRRIVMKNGPLSFYSWTQFPEVTWPAANFIRGVLKEFDVPDCLRALGNKVSLIEPWNPTMQPYQRKELMPALKQAGLPLKILVPSVKG